MKELKEFTEKEWDVFCDALDFADLAARRDFLDRACAGDATLRKQIEELLVLQPQVDRFFADAADWLHNPSPAPPSSSLKKTAP